MRLEELGFHLGLVQVIHLEGVEVIHHNLNRTKEEDTDHLDNIQIIEDLLHLEDRQLGED
jgi:hypothetical protein